MREAWQATSTLTEMTLLRGIGMDPRQLYVDERLSGLRFCVYCGREPSTRDHVPSRVLLDKPYPPNLPVVPASEDCNRGISLDEQYVACLIECVASRSASLDAVGREKMRRLLSENPALKARLAQCQNKTRCGGTIWRVEAQRIERVILKLAQGHVAYQLCQPQFEEPRRISIMPLVEMSDKERQTFETLPDETVFPEIGGRVFISVAEDSSQYAVNGWFVVQDGRYRYAVTWSQGIGVRMVLSEYLACEVVWG